jgi:hypothetical protein
VNVLRCDGKISKDVKLKVAKKVEEFTTEVPQYQNVNTYSKFFINKDNDIFSKLGSYICEPYF